jgi:hypothetical protein
VNSVGDGEGIIRCKELVDQGFKRFEVSAILDTMLRVNNFLLDIHINCSTNGRDIFSSRS